MKNITKPLAAFAALAFFGSCMVSVFGLLVVLMASFGFADGLPLSYYLKLYIAEFSVALPMAGMILIAAIYLGLSGKRAEVVKSTVIEGAINLSVSEEEKQEEPELIAA